MKTYALDRAVEAAAALDLARVPDSVVTHAGHVVADTVAVMRAGALLPEMTRLVAIAVDEGTINNDGLGSANGILNGPWSSTVLTSPLRYAPAAVAAFVNATSGTFLELDEGMRPTGHPAVHILPAALSVAERAHASGASLLRALLAGYEIASRLFRAFRLRYPVHPHGHFGGIGAAVACALLDDVDPIQAARIAGTTPLLPVWEACFDGATARNTYVGLAAQCGVQASALAKAGFTGSQSALNVAYGLVAGDLVEPDVLSSSLKYTDLGITRNYFKVHSACALTHAAIDAALDLRVPTAAVIRRIHVETVSNNLKIARQPKPNDLSCRFSLPYAVAAAILLHRSDPAAFHFRPEVAQLARKVVVTAVADLEDQWPASSPARVTVKWEGGQSTKTVRNPRGHYTNPITADELRDKFFSLLNSPHEANSWWRQLNDLQAVSDCAELLSTRHG